MFAVEVYLPSGVLCSSKDSRREAARVFRFEPRDGGQDVPVSLPRGRRARAGDEAEAGPLLPVIDAILDMDRQRR